MKTRIYVFAFALLCTIFAAQGNDYIWLHGLNDGTDCWSIYQQAFTPSNGNTFYYDSKSGIEKMSFDMWASKSASFGSGTILIGHSMGGLIARELEYNHSGSIKGIITIGTPHQGAPVLGELYNGGANNLTRKVGNKAKSSVQASVTAICFTIPGVGFVLPVSINLGIDGLYKYVGLPYIDKTINEEVAKDYGADCSKDMIPGSTYMNKIANRKVNVPILTFACQEDRWQLARLGYCTQNQSTLQTDATINTDGNFDMGGYNQLNSLNSTFKTVGGVHAGIAGACAVGGFFFPYLWAASAAHGVASGSWYSTAGYIDDGLDFDHAVLLGSYHVDRIDTQHRFLWWKWTTTTYVTVPEPHDGVVGINSQQLDKSKGTNVIWANATIKGVNHMEEFNHYKTRAEFDKVINGDGTYPPIFKK
jgi:pimeloyl-ACP methyl ester carboxylesterase